MSMYGADTAALQHLYDEFEHHRQFVWEQLIETVRVRVKGIYWRGADRQKTLDAVVATVSMPVVEFIVEVRHAQHLLYEAIATQHAASNVH